MACFHPRPAVRGPDGRVIFVNHTDLCHFHLPCGQCIGCRRERSRQWAMRCVHEASMHEFNCFITLTYAPEHLPDFGSLRYRDFQLFMKRLRRHFSDVPIRFYMCGEYGENFNRPHYHACLFGIDFADKKVFSRANSSFVYVSETLQRLWPFGYSSLGDVNFESAAYVARYVMKKITGKAADSHYEVVDTSTGEISKRVPEFTKMSLKPGIGATWFDKFKFDVYPHDRVIIRGKKLTPPRFYLRRLKRSDESLYESLVKKHLDYSRKQTDNNAARRSVKEHLAAERLKYLKRNSF